MGAPACARFTAEADPERHLRAAAALGADTRGAVGPEDAGEALAGAIVSLMRKCEMPNGLGGVGYAREDVPLLVEGAWPQQRLLCNSPRPVAEADLDAVLRDALAYW